MSVSTYSREVRLGIVMYGGVSLAVYENGVANELYRAVKGKGIYEFVKKLVDSEIVVDVISGTSAGGINGIFLAYALANGRDFSACSELWRNQGDILKLMRSTSDERAMSLLNSEGYYQPHLEDAFKKIDQNKDEPAQPSEIDLFITGTNYKGRIFTAYDDKGDPIDVKDHRSVFILSYRPERKNPFTLENIPQLAKLARLTSCFPVAFAPVHVAAKPDTGKPDPDAALREWGNLSDEEAYFLDGGVLDNKPFSYTIDAIFGRTADRKVERIMFYVEPDPERFKQSEASDQTVATPNVAQAAMEALVGIPGYESIANDLQSIADHNDRVARYVEMRNSVLKPTDDGNSPIFPDLIQKPETDEVDYFQRTSEGSPSVGVYLRARLMAVRDRVLLGILKNGKQLVQRSTPRERHAARILVQSFDEFRGDGRPTLREFDVYYRIRHLFDAVYAIYDQLYRPGGPRSGTAPETYKEVWRRLNHQLQVYEILRYALETAIDYSEINIDDLSTIADPDSDQARAIAQQKWIDVQNVLRHILDPVTALPDAAIRDWTNVSDAERSANERQQRNDFLKALRQRLADLQKETKRTGRIPTTSPATNNLLRQLEAQDRAILRRIDNGNDPVRKAFCGFIFADSCLFPIAQLSGIASRDILKTVRISPIDGHYGFKAGEIDGKLCGRTLAHFGGFLKSSWRANDIVAGRLDAIAQLIECIVTPDRVLELAGPERTASDRFCDLRGLLLRVFHDPTDRELIEKDVLTLEEKAVAARQDPLGDGAKGFREFLDRLVKACQREMLEEEVPEVVRAAIAQQKDWNQYERIGSLRIPFLPRLRRWILGNRQVDSAVLNYATEKQLEKPSNSRVQSWTDWYNSSGYTVASESIADGVPKAVLLEMASGAALILSNCLHAVLGGKWTRRITENRVFRFGVDYPMRTIYTFAQFQRTAGDFARIVVAAVYTLALVMPVVAGIYHDPLLMSGGAIHVKNIAFLILLPLLLLLTTSFMLGAMRALAYVVLTAVSAILFVQMVHTSAIERIGAGRITGVIEWLWNNRYPLWLGALAAVIVTLPSRQLWDDLGNLLTAITKSITQWAVKATTSSSGGPPNPERPRIFSFRVDKTPVEK